MVGLYVQPSVIQKHASICVDTFSEEPANAMVSQESLDEHLTGDRLGGVFRGFKAPSTLAWVVAEDAFYRINNAARHNARNARTVQAQHQCSTSPGEPQPVHTTAHFFSWNTLVRSTSTVQLKSTLNSKLNHAFMLTSARCRQHF